MEDKSPIDKLIKGLTDNGMKPTYMDAINAAVNQITQIGYNSWNVRVRYKDCLLLKGWKRIPRKLRKRMRSLGRIC